MINIKGIKSATFGHLLYMKKGRYQGQLINFHPICLSDVSFSNVKDCGRRPRLVGRNTCSVFFCVEIEVSLRYPRVDFV